MNIQIRTIVEGFYQDVIKKFDRELFEQLTPPGAKVELVQFDGSHKGNIVHLRMTLAGFIKQDWVSEITQEGQTYRRAWFTDEGTRLPFFLKSWKHNHIVENHGSRSIIVDDIHFESPSLILDPLLYPILYFQFYWRKKIYWKVFGKPPVTRPGEERN
jgi:ligand-binding SRPBCC domain-containing protein